ncbi:unnamed protein product [Didymodactylos carnosus]|uniref:Phenylalanyl-tRNA synthetase domain-containing protein n=1 Tax=Didymodactylos carnosus TaxID=1234261 RepID=A0A8S2I6H6_9BILA|nr:unnamed protein product [Didymodactylos carnosus]CAF3703068.1 unnamed protein product [Didymodactylos carnosus]
MQPLFTSLELELKSTAPAERKQVGLRYRQLKEASLELKRSRLVELEAEILTQALKPPVVSPYVSAYRQSLGDLHPLTLTANRIVRFLERISFTVLEGEELVDPKLNFDKLNIPLSHPARSPQESFFAKNGNVLRTHVTSTTALQLALNREQSEVRVAAFGRVYRNDEDDATHSHQFMQLDFF